MHYFKYINFEFIFNDIRRVVLIFSGLYSGTLLYFPDHLNLIKHKPESLLTLTLCYKGYPFKFPSIYQYIMKNRDYYLSFKHLITIETLCT